MSETAVERRLREMAETVERYRNNAQAMLAVKDGLDDETRRHYHEYADERGKAADAIDAGREAIRLLRSMPRKRGCPWCGTVWTTRPACCPPDDKRRALLARCEGETR